MLVSDTDLIKAEIRVCWSISGLKGRAYFCRNLELRVSGSILAYSLTPRYLKSSRSKSFYLKISTYSRVLNLKRLEISYNCRAEV